MHRFDYSGLCDNLPSDIVTLIKLIGSAAVKEEYRRDAYPKEYLQIQSIAKLASAKYSNEIENITSTDDRIAELILRGGRPRTHSEEEIAGYGEALDVIHTEPLGFDKDTITRLHSIIRAGLPEDRGHYKTRDNAIVSVDENNVRHIVMRTVPFRKTGECMQKLMDAYLIAESEGMEPLILIPCVIVDYLCIHPFMDGNGRTSRLLTYMLLYSHGMDVCRYVSLDEHIAYTKGEYYQALYDSSQGWEDNTGTYIPFIRYFLRMLYECYTDLDTRFAMKNAKGMKKNERIENILKESLVPISKRQIQMALPDVSIHTVNSVINRLMSEGSLEKVGSFRDARYRYVKHRSQGV